MTTDPGCPRPTQACVNCKVRKKKCNKALPSCSYCTQKELDCRYATPTRPSRHGSGNLVRQASVGHATLSAAGYGLTPSDSAASEISIREVSLYRPTLANLEGVYREVYQIIRSTGRFVDDITAQYFQTFHRHLPVISRPRFQQNLVLTDGAPGDDVSVLLLVVSLITFNPAPKDQDGDGSDQRWNHHSLHLATKSLLSQVMTTQPPSVHLVQANLLLALYEYAHGQPSVAFATIATCARLGYAAGIGKRRPFSMHVLATYSREFVTKLQLETEEAANTWWGVTIIERVIFCELDSFEQPLITVFPPGDAQLPIEPDTLNQSDRLEPNSIANIPVSCLTGKIGGFGRTAQACCLLEQLLGALSITDINSKLLQLEGLDTALQAFLALVLPQCRGEWGVFCAAIATAIRALFTLHWHIVSIPPTIVSAKFRPLEEWQNISRAALDTAATIVYDIAESHGTLSARLVDATPPTHNYILRAALKHIRTGPQGKDPSWLANAEEKMQKTLERFSHRWTANLD